MCGGESRGVPQGRNRQAIDGSGQTAERMKELCKERDNLYEKQNDLKGKKWKIERSLELQGMWGMAVALSCLILLW